MRPRPRAEDHPPIPVERAAFWMEDLNGEAHLSLSGARFEEIREGYARVRLPWRPELIQGDGVIYGGAIAALLDSAAVGAVGSGLERRPTRMATVSLQVHFLAAAKAGDVVAEARVRRRGRTMVFLEVEALDERGVTVAHGELAYLVTP